MDHGQLLPGRHEHQHPASEDRRHGRRPPLSRRGARNCPLRIPGDAETLRAALPLCRNLGPSGSHAIGLPLHQCRTQPLESMSWTMPAATASPPQPSSPAWRRRMTARSTSTSPARFPCSMRWRLLPAPSASQLPVRIVVSSKPYVDSANQFWASDRYFSGGRHGLPPESAKQGNLGLYESDRIGRFRYNIPAVPLAHYRVRLYFREPWFGKENGGAGGPGSRVFDVACNGEMLVKNFDILAAGGLRAQSSRPSTTSRPAPAAGSNSPSCPWSTTPSSTPSRFFPKTK